MRPVTIHDGRVVTHGAVDTLSYAELTDAYQRQLDHTNFLRDTYQGKIATLESRLAAAETALADRDRHFLWDDRLRMERELGDLALRLATVEAERDRWQTRAEWLTTVRSSMDTPDYVPASPGYPGGWGIVGVPGFYPTRWEAIDAAATHAPTPGDTP